MDSTAQKAKFKADSARVEARLEDLIDTMAQLGMEAEIDQLCTELLRMKRSVKKQQTSVLVKPFIPAAVSSLIGAIAAGTGAFFGARKANWGKTGTIFSAVGGAAAGSGIGGLAGLLLFKEQLLGAAKEADVWGQKMVENLSALITKYTEKVRKHQEKHLQALPIGAAETPVAETSIPGNTARYATSRSPSFAAQADMEKMQAAQTARTLH